MTVGSSWCSACAASVAPVLLTSWSVYVRPKAAQSLGLTGIRVAVSATHPAGGTLAAARGFADPEVEGEVAQAATQSVKQAAIRIFFNIKNMVDRALSQRKAYGGTPPLSAGYTPRLRVAAGRLASTRCYDHALNRVPGKPAAPPSTQGQRTAILIGHEA
jgi:hypothetical protein